MKKKELLLFVVLTFSLALFLSGCSPLNDAPTAKFSADSDSGKAPLDVSFDASDSNDPDGEIASYDWDFDDDETATGETVSHTFEAEGSYEVTLTVTDDGGDTDTRTTTIEVTARNQPPSASFTMAATDDSAPFHVNFYAGDSSDPDGTIESYEWSLGDGSTKSGETCSNTYYNSGDFEIQLTVTDDEGASSVASNTLTLPTESNSNQRPLASFTASPKSGTAPLDV
ncbi:PKD domain-containing protein, partial [Candidatus Bipolaricaulota bacterium]|nr:PKD domain-containing protein [Candidatus Bipolaricaulota bacterium]